MSEARWMETNVILDIRPGITSALYFIFFDMILITVVDMVMTRVMSYHYYNTVYNGQQLTLKSANIPGVTTFLIGDFHSPANIIALLIKVTFLVAIFIVDLKINSCEAYDKEVIYRTAYMNINASYVAWEPARNPRVSVTWPDSQNCRMINYDNGTIIYYALALNLDDNVTLEGEKYEPSDSIRRDFYPIDSESVQCLAPGKVAEENVLPIARVLGCSKVDSSGCTNLELVTYQVRVGNEAIKNKVSVTFESTHFDFALDETQDLRLEGAWEAYRNPKLSCISVGFRSKSQQPNFRYNCLLVAEYVNKNNISGTLVEHWTINRQNMRHNRSYILRDNLIELLRYYPGPVFEGHLDIGQVQTAYLLLLLGYAGRQSNWASVSSILVKNAASYTRMDKEITVSHETFQQTEIPAYAVLIIIIIIAAVLVSLTVVSIKFGISYRPALNNINDLALMAKERHLSSIDCFKQNENSANTLEAELVMRCYSLSSRSLAETFPRTDTTSSDSSNEQGRSYVNNSKNKLQP